MALEDDLDALYACLPAEFLDRRKALAQALRKAGKKEDAAAVAGALKPTPAAWAVNQLARKEPTEMAALGDAGERLRALLRASFKGHVDAAATSEAQAAQREIVARLGQLAGQLLEAAGLSRSDSVLERIATTLTTVSTTGAWGGSPPARLTRELDPPGIEALAALVSDVASAPERREEGALERARGALALATSEREQRETAAREARSLATAEEQAADEARRKAEASALAARTAEEEARAAARAELEAKKHLAAAEEAHEHARRPLA